MSDKRRTAVIATVAIAALAAGGTAVAAARGGGDDDASETPIRGETLERAGAIAVEHVGSGKVTGSEAGDEEGAYEIEVTRADGREVDVHLGEDLDVLGSSAEEDSGEDAD